MIKLQPNPNNPRTISDEAFERLKNKIKRNPDGLSAHKIVHKDGIIIAGNQRWRAIQELKLELKDNWFKDVSGWTDEQIREWLVTSNISDGEWDMDMLANQYELSELDEWGLELPQYDENDENDDELYSDKIEAPIYEITGEQPELTELYDTTKTDELTQKIESLDAPEEVKQFLRAAANRLTAFNYRNIAEYYAHQPKELQEIFESLALVIIDFDKAIEQGYVQLDAASAQQYRDETNE